MIEGQKPTYEFGEFRLDVMNRRVAFILEDHTNKTRRLLISNLNGSNETALVTLPPEQLSTRGVAWSPDNSMIAVGASGEPTQPNQSISLIQPANGKASSLTPPMWRDISRIVWLKDGSGLVVIAAGADPQEGRQVWFVTYPRGEVRRLTHDYNIYDVGLSVPTDSSSLLLVQHQQMVNIWAGPANDFSKAKQITFTAFNPTNGNMTFDWLPNGLVYASSPGHGLNLWTMDASGQNSREITSPGNDDSGPSATADGRFVVFASSRGGTDDIWRSDIDGANAQQLTKCGKNYQPSVSPDGKWVVYVGACDGVGTLWRVPLAGGEPERLTDRGSVWPWVSPDSKWIACAYRTTPDKFQLAIVPIEGGPPARLFDVPTRANFNFGIRWTPDGKAVTYRNWGTGLWRQAADGGPPEQLPGLPDEKIGCFGWSRDGKHFAFNRDTEIRDVVLIRNSN